MTEKEQFYGILKMAVLLVFCILAIGMLDILEEVTATNSFGLDGIIATLKDGLLMLLGCLVALVRQHGVAINPAPSPVVQTTESQK